MIELTGTLGFAVGILVLFLLDRDRSARTSTALWIPVLWVFLASSRPVSSWLNARAVTDTTDRYLDGSPVDRYVFTVLIVLALAVLFDRRRQVGALLRANGPIVLFLLYCGLSIFWSDFPEVALKRWIRAVGDIAMVFVLLTDPDPPAALKRLFARTGFLIIPLSILFDLGRGFYGAEGRYYTGVTLNKNMLGVSCLILGLGSAWLFLQTLQSEEREARSRRLITHGAIAALAFWLIWRANSATSLACFLIGASLLVFTHLCSFARKRAVLHVVVASLVFLALYASILDPNVGIVTTMGKDPTLTGRTELWNTLIRMAPDPWFGTGFETFWTGSRLTKLWTIFTWRPNEAHNGYIEVYLNLGWMGVILLALVVVTGYRKVLNGIRQDPDTGSLRLTYFVVALVFSLAEAGFRMFSPVWFFFLFAVMADFTRQPQPAKAQPVRMVPAVASQPVLD